MSRRPRPHASWNGLAARVRILERSEVSSSIARDTFAGTVMSTAALCHDILDRHNGVHSHCLDKAIRTALLAKLVDDRTARRLKRLALAANVVRHTTVFSLQRLVADLESALGTVSDQLDSAEIFDIASLGGADLETIDLCDWVTPSDDSSDVVDLLVGMCDSPRPVLCAGGVLLSGASAGVDRPGGLSLFTLREQQCERARVVVRDARMVITSAGDLTVGDLVAPMSSPGIYKIIRVGYGIYEDEVRVLRPTEDPALWEAGRWLPVGCLHRLVAEQVVEITEPIELENGRVVTLGSRGVIEEFCWDYVVIALSDLTFERQREQFHLLRVALGSR